MKLYVYPRSPRIRQAAVGRFLRHAPIGVAATVLNALLLAITIGDPFPAPVHAWAGGLLLLSLIRLPGLLRNARRTLEGDPALTRRLALRCFSSMAISGLAWGIGAFIFLDQPLGGYSATLYLVVVAGMAAGAATAFAVLPAAALAFMTGCMGPVVLRLVDIGGREGWLAAAIAIVFFTLMSLLVLQTYGTFARYINNLHRYREARGSLDNLTEHSREIERQAREATDQAAQMRLALRDKEALLTAVVMQAPLAVMVADAHGKVLLVDGRLAERMAEIFELHVGSQISQVFHQQPRLMEAFGRAQHGQQSVVLWEEDDQQMELAIGPFQESISDRPGIVAVMVDASEQHRARQLQESFVTNVNHQLRTPLTSMMGYLELALLEDLPTELRSYLDAACRNAHRMQRLVDQVDRLDNDDFGPPDRLPGPRFEAVAEALFNQHNQPAQCVLAIANDSPEICARISEDALRTLLDGLLKNAVAYAEPGTLVRLGLSTTLGEDGLPRLQGRLTNEGSPIPRILREALFDKFTVGDNRDDRRQYGLGLGLYLCRKAAESCGGSIWLERSDGRETVFGFTIPAVADQRPTEVLQE